MNTKKILIIVAIFLGLIIVGAYIFIVQKSDFGIGDNQNIQNFSTHDTQNYYDKLANDCKNKQGESCCLASVRTMKQGDYTLAPQEGCPAGYQSDMMRCIDSYRWCQPAETPADNTINQSTNLTLDFFAGGSIFGGSFEVKISGTNITYHETTQGGGKEVQKIERVLLPNERADIQKVVADAELVTLQSQDFTKDPLAPDQASYRISVSVDGKQNTIHCGIIPPGTRPTTNCQKQIDTLRLKLNGILGVNIY